MLIDHIISGIGKLRIGEVILKGDNITLLYYRHQFMGSLHHDIGLLSSHDFTNLLCFMSSQT